MYASGIQEFQTRLDQLHIEQAKLAEALADDKRCLEEAGFSSFRVLMMCMQCVNSDLYSLQPPEDGGAAGEDNGNSPALPQGQTHWQYV